jgi:predicted helicase
LLANLAIESGQYISEDAVTAISYRPFDNRYAYYSKTLTSNLDRNIQIPASYRSRGELMQNMWRSNLALLVPRQLAKSGYYHAFVADKIPEMCVISNVTKEQNVVFPLYTYPQSDTLDQTIRVNFDTKLYTRIRKAAGLAGTPSTPDGTNDFREATGDTRPDEVKVFDYIYGVLHCPAYRARYAEFLKIDFPRIPFPASSEDFRAISEQGEMLRRLHLMEDAAIGATPYPFHGDGNSVVEKARYENGQVWINANQYFDAVPAIAWDFHIGGYQPAQKWLKDRKGRALTYDDIRHYQRIIKILTETDRIMSEIDMPLD